jgi:hypothetical protein
MHTLMKQALAQGVHDRLARQLGLSVAGVPAVSRRSVLHAIAGSGLVLGFGSFATSEASAAALGAEGAAAGPLAPNPFVRIGTTRWARAI